jgi:hypothetical protein
MVEENRPTRPELLKEYELCQSDAQGLESIIWQTGTAIGIGSIGTLIIIANHPISEQPPWQVAAIIGILILLMSIIWLGMARRWWSIQHAFFMRMRHIEKELGLYQARYIQYLDHPDTLSESGLPDSFANEIRSRAGKRKKLLPIHQRRGIQSILVFLPVVILIPWAIYTLWLFSNS